MSTVAFGMIYSRFIQAVKYTFPFSLLLMPFFPPQCKIKILLLHAYKTRNSCNNVFLHVTHGRVVCFVVGFVLGFGGFFVVFFCLFFK